MANDDTPVKVRCGSCEDPYKKEALNITPDDEKIVGGYWFCRWCYEYTEDSELLARAEDGQVRPVFTEEETDAGVEEWDDPHKKFTE